MTGWDVWIFFVKHGTLRSWNVMRNIEKKKKKKAKKQRLVMRLLQKSKCEIKRKGTTNREKEIKMK